MSDRYRELIPLVLSGAVENELGVGREILDRAEGVRERVSARQRVPGGRVGKVGRRLQHVLRARLSKKQQRPAAIGPALRLKGGRIVRQLECPIERRWCLTRQALDCRE